MDVDTLEEVDRDDGTAVNDVTEEVGLGDASVEDHVELVVVDLAASRMGQQEEHKDQDTSEAK